MKTKIVRNDKISISLSAENGCIESICFKDKQWNGYSGGLTIIDELKGRIFSNSPIKIIEDLQNNKIVFERRFPCAEFIVREIWTALDDCISWRIELLLDEGCTGRTIQMKQLVPYPYPAYNLNVWTAHENFPCKLEKLGGLHLGYGDACYGTVIPAVSIYNEASDSGLTLAKPFDLKTARLAFNFNDYHSSGLEVISSNLALKGKSPAVMEILIRPHEGCWRPALAWLYDKYREYFNPPNPDIHKLDGGFMLTNPFTEKSFIEDVYKYKVKWAEIHNHFPYYGNYAPKEDEWESVIAHDYPELPPLPSKVSRKCINEHIELLHKNNIKGFLYFQCAGDSYIPYAREDFPDAIARDVAGKIIPTWKECCFVNASSGTSFYKHIDKQIDKFISDYPDIDGVFLDQVCYQAIDIAHEDGITSYNNKPAAMFGYSYTETLQKLSDILHGQGKFIWGNGPFDIEVQKNIDGIMAEGTSGISETYKYLCLTKPLLVHTYPDTPEKVETMFKYCLLSGASYSIGASSKLPLPQSITPEVQKIFDAYIPLVEKLFGRTWILEPQALKVPVGYHSNIFRGRDGHSIMVPLIKSKCGLTGEDIYNKDIEINIKVKDAVNFSEAAILTTNSEISQDIEIRNNNNIIAVSVKTPAVASVIIIR